MAPMNGTRIQPGSILLQSLRAYVFSGAQDKGVCLNSIESLASECSWKILPLNECLAKIYDLSAV